MGNAVYPLLPGLLFPIGSSPKFNTRVTASITGAEVRTPLQLYPLYTLKLAYEFLRDLPSADIPASPADELKKLLGFFLARQGMCDSFLFMHPSDYMTTGAVIALGDGTTKDFQLTRTYGVFSGAEFVEPVQNVNIITNVKVDGTPTTAYTISGSGLISFTSAPAAGKAITWSGSYYYRCRFDVDELDLDQFMQNLWEAKTVPMLGSPTNKLL